MAAIRTDVTLVEQGGTLAVADPQLTVNHAVPPALAPLVHRFARIEVGVLVRFRDGADETVTFSLKLDAGDLPTLWSQGDPVGYSVNSAELNPNDPIVNTASEYMYQMAVISYHTLNATTTVTDELTRPSSVAATHKPVANALAPAARTGMTEKVFADLMARKDDAAFDHYAPENVAPLVVWLCSPLSKDVRGRVFEVEGGKVSVADGWRTGEVADKQARWNPEELTEVIHGLIERGRKPQKVYGT